MAGISLFLLSCFNWMTVGVTASVNLPRKRSERSPKQKFVGRRINHYVIVDDLTQETDWYKETVLEVLTGRDGDSYAVYEIVYDHENKPYEVDHIGEDFLN